jgi:phosphatidylethanolamine-binding protein (PEBP) family uncharacterized protein
MKFWSDEIKDGAYIPTKYAAGAANLKGFAPNLNPPLAWSEVPEGVQSFVLICHDPDAPSTMEDVNKPDREVPAATPRANFYHWLLIDLPATLRQIKEGEFCNGFTVQGKAGPEVAYGSRQGLNDYTNWFAGDAKMEGKYFGYDGPYPPGNDSILHRYIFSLYALAVPKLDMAANPFNGPQLMVALAELQSQGSVLALSSFRGTYSTNPRLQP